MALCRASTNLALEALKTWVAETMASSVRIAADTVLHRPDDDAPVSNLFLFGRKQDLAFEQPIAGGPGKRHHERFWR